MTMTGLKTLALALALALPGAAQATTFNVVATGTINAVNDGPFDVGPLPYALGDTATASFTVTDEGPAGIDIIGTNSGEAWQYFDAVTALSGTFGSYSFTGGPLPPGTSSGQNNVVIYNDLTGGNDLYSDRTLVFNGVTGADILGYTPTRFSFSLGQNVFDDPTPLYLDSGAITPEAFSQGFLDVAQTRYIQILHGTFPGNDWIMAQAALTSITITPVAAVPLPAAGWLMVTALGALGLARRRARST